MRADKITEMWTEQINNELCILGTIQVTNERNVSADRTAALTAVRDVLLTDGCFWPLRQELGRGRRKDGAVPADDDSFFNSVTKHKRSEERPALM